MKNEVYEIEADSLELARKQAKDKVPTGLRLLSEVILCDGKERTKEGIADSATGAFEKARKDVPNGAAIVSEKELIPTSHSSIEVEAFDEQAARLSAKPKIGNKAVIESLVLKTSGKKGFLGMGKKPHIYQINVFQPSVVEVRFKLKAKIRIEIGEIPSTGYCQMCGKSNSPVEKTEKSAHVFCSGTCRDQYFKAKVAALLFSPDRFIMNATGQDISSMISSGRAMAESAMSYCWSCGHQVHMTENKCGFCGVNQEIKI
jgi:hypothetical protein